MELSKARQLREKRAKLHADAQEILKKETITAEDRTKFDAMMAEMDTLKGDIDRLERSDRDAAELRATTDPPQTQPGAAPGATTPEPEEQNRLQQRYVVKGEDGLTVAEKQALSTYIDRDKRHRRAFRDYLRNGDMATSYQRGMSEESRKTLAEFRDMGITTGTLGGYFVPQGFVYDVEIALKYYGNMLVVSRILDTATGNPLPYPTMTDVTNTGELVGEGVQVTEADVTIGHIIFGAYKFSTKMVKVSLELLQDSAFDIESFLKDAFAIRLGRILNTKFTVGAGTTEPLGILTAAVANDGTPTLASTSVTVGVPVIAAGSGANTGNSDSAQTTIGSQDIVNLEHTIDPLYRPKAQYMMHDSTLRALKNVLDKYGRPLWQPSITVGEPDRINGYPYSVNDDMPLCAHSLNSVVFGPLDKYIIRRVKELAVLRLVERFADYGQVAFIGFARYDGNLLDAGTHPISYLQQA